jgi:Flp pilus assembly protein protease CpaA
MYEYIFINFAIVFIALIYSTITDIKYREVSNWVSLGLLIYGTIANAIYFGIVKGYLSTIYFLIFVAIVFCVCYLFWKLGIFAAGDAKLYSGIAAVIPVQLISLIGAINSTMPFILSLFILSILLMLPIAGFKLFFAYFKHTKVKETLSKSIKNNFWSFVLNIIYVVSLYFVFSFFTWPIWVFILVSIILGFVPKKIRYPISVVLFLVSIIINTLNTVYYMIFAIVFALFIAFMIQLFVLSRSGLLNEKKKVMALKEGDLLAYPLIKGLNGLEELKFEFWKEMKIAFKLSLKQGKEPILALFKRRKDLYSKIVINNSLACGLTQEEVNKVKKHFNNEKIELKETTPLVPSIFLAYVIMICFGDIIWYLINLL